MASQYFSMTSGSLSVLCFSLRSEKELASIYIYKMRMRRGGLQFDEMDFEDMLMPQLSVFFSSSSHAQCQYWVVFHDAARQTLLLLMLDPQMHKCVHSSSSQYAASPKNREIWERNFLLLPPEEEKVTLGFLRCTLHAPP